MLPQRRARSALPPPRARSVLRRRPRGVDALRRGAFPPSAFGATPTAGGGLFGASRRLRVEDCSVRRHPRPVVVCSAPLRLRRPRQVAVCLERRGERFRRAEARRWFIRRRAFDTRDGWWTLRRKHGCFYARGGRWLIRCLCSGHWRRVVWCRRSSAHAGRRVVRRRVLRGGDARVRWVRGIISGAHLGSAPAASGGAFGAAATPASTPGGGLFGASAPAAGGGLFGASAPAAGVPRRWSLRCGETGWWWSLWCGSEHGRWFIRCRAEHGAAPGGGLFGASAPSSAPSGGLFGAAPAAGGGLFGASAPAAGGGIFGGGLGSAQPRGCARSVRRATGGDATPCGSPLQPPQLALATTEPAPAKQSLLGRCKSGRWRCGDRVSCAFAHASITVAHEPWWHQQRAEASRRGVGVVAGRRRAKRGNAGVGPATWKRCLCRDAVERWMVV